MRILPFIKNALTNKRYYPSYFGYGISGFLVTIYLFEWEAVGRYIPVWNKFRYIDENEEKSLPKFQKKELERVKPF